MILDGTKNHTARKDRKGRQGHAKPGDIVYLYFGMRTKWCRKLGQAKCTKTESIEIDTAGNIRLDGKRLSYMENSAFAWADGFRPEGSTAKDHVGAFTLMFRFWKATNDLPFKGTVIYWEPLIPEFEVVGEDPDFFAGGFDYE